jgi:acetyltransferase-like isoleucine patch superfamily enzyme
MMTAPTLHLLNPGAALPGDWFSGRIPCNIIAGQNVMIDSAFCFKRYFATGPVGLRVGDNVTIWRTALSVEPEGAVEIGDHCYLANASLVCASRITLGARVLVAGGVTIADSDFHPLAPAARLAETVALSPVGDARRRPRVEARPVVIEDDVWIGYNATILKGVRVGAGAVIAPGALVVRDVPPGDYVAGHPARPVKGGET